MHKPASGNFRQLLKDLDFVIVGGEVKGCLSYLPYGLEVRNRLYDIAIADLKQLGFKQLLLTDIVPKAAISKMEIADANAKNFFSVENANFAMAAGHEIPFYLFLRQSLKNTSRRIDFPLQYFHFGSGYRYPKNGSFPFAMGERKSFLECYSVHPTAIEAEQALNIGVQWNRRLINDILRLPTIEVVRPIVTNKKLSKRTICIDSLTPIGRTVITGMTYFHDDIFSRLLDVKYKDNRGNSSFVHVAHFGISENLLFAYLLNAANPSGLRILNILSPVQVLILDTTSKSRNEEIQELVEYLQNLEIRYFIQQITPDRLRLEMQMHVKKGVPVIISVTKSNEKGTRIQYHFHNELKTSTVSELQSIILTILKRNDELIWADFCKSKQEAIINCYSIADVIKCVNQGKIAVVYSSDSDLKVLELEKKISGAEILGFEKTLEIGNDIMTHEPTSLKAYISKRA